jgi:transcriptional regulator with XRE-family HTH domain
VAEQKKTKQQIQAQRWDQAVMAVWGATRRDCDVSQQQLATKLGWTRDMVASVERGRRKVSVTEMIQFAQALGIDPETVFRRILRW